MRHRHRYSLALTLAVLALAATPALAQYEAITKASRDVEMSFSVSGRVLEIHVEHGQEVKAGTPLIELDNELGKAQIAKLKLAHKSKIEIEQQKKKFEFAQWHLEETKRLQDSGSGSPHELRRATVQRDIEKLALDKARDFDKKILEKDLERANADDKRYTITAVSDGVIEKVKGEDVEVGETVQPNQPVVRVVNVKELIIDVPIPTREALALKLNDEAWVQSNFAGHDQPVRGYISQIALVADAASRKTRVRITVPNKDKYLGAGWHVKVYLSKPDTMAKAANDQPEAERR